MLEYLGSNDIGVYFIIFFGKIIEVAIATVRLVLISRGQRTVGATIAFLEVLIWIFISGSVIVGVAKYPLKAIVYSVAFALGTYLGSMLEDYLALGLSTIQIITSEDTKELQQILRENYLAVTAIKGEGKDGTKDILTIHLKRKRVKSTVTLISTHLTNSLITVTDVKIIKGGYIRK
jgi:uncharacterized protein YebE (UPF0316 family)